MKIRQFASWFADDVINFLGIASELRSDIINYVYEGMNVKEENGVLIPTRPELHTGVYDEDSDIHIDRFFKDMYFHFCLSKRTAWKETIHDNRNAMRSRIMLRERMHMERQELSYPAPPREVIDFITPMIKDRRTILRVDRLKLLTIIHRWSLSWKVMKGANGRGVIADDCIALFLFLEEKHLMRYQLDENFKIKDNPRRNFKGYISMILNYCDITNVNPNSFAAKLKRGFDMTVYISQHSEFNEIRKKMLKCIEISDD